MLLKYFYDDQLAQASYMIGCQATGEALVIDPARDIVPYVEVAESEGVRITHITETHIHADFVSGSRELAASTGGTIYLSDMGDGDWKYAYADQPNVVSVHDDDEFMVGNIRVQVLHTMGHTPEHISFMITDTANAEHPIGVFTGDFLFVGDIGRPDLLEEAAGIMGTREIGARQQFASVTKFKALPDYLQIWPGHGAGSACGKALGAIPSTTLGYEKMVNPAFQFEQESDFVDWLLDGQPEAPRYFGQMKHVNKQGPALLKDLVEPQPLDPATLDQLLKEDRFVADLRDRETFVDAHVLGTVSVPATSSNFSTYIGWFVNYDDPFYIISDSPENTESLVRSLRAIGIDNIPGYFLPKDVSEATESLPVISADKLAEKLPQGEVLILDVRGLSEYDDKHIKGAKHIVLGRLPDHLSELPRDTTIVTHCASGFRSQIAASFLRARGFDNIVNLDDEEALWTKLLTTESL